MLVRHRAVWLGVLASLSVHLTAALVLSRLPPAAAMVPALAHYEVEVTVQAGQRPGSPEQDAPMGQVLARSGGSESPQNVDGRIRGDRGDRLGASEFILLVPRADAVTLQDSPQTSWRMGQTQRIRTARDRATRESRRATPNPADEVFLASGSGHHPERRPVSTRDARPGARRAPAASDEGALSARAGAGDRPRPRGVPTMAVAALPPSAAGGSHRSPGRGILRGRGERAAAAAHVAHGRPLVDRGPAATPAELRDARVRDSRDAELLAAQLVQSMVEASERRGPRTGPGRGGVGGGGAPGSGGGEGEGGRASAHGPGPGSYAALDTSNRRYSRWFVELRRRVHDRLDFPRARLLAMDQGWSVYRFSVRRDGTLAGSPQLLRSSGFSDLDLAARAAIEQAAPFPPLPGLLAGGMESHAVSIRVEHSNPMVR